MRLLIVDDVPDNIRVLMSMLAGEGLQISAATSGRQALILAGTCSPDLVILDVMMPEMNGYEVCSALKADPVLAAIPVIFITALAGDDEETRGLSLGAVDYITKPFQETIVKLRVRTHLELKRQRDSVDRLNMELESRVMSRTAELEAAVREMEALTYSIAHDVRSPVRAVEGFATLLAEGYGPVLDQEGHRILGRMTKNARRIGRLIDDLLTFSHTSRTAMEKAPVDMTSLVQDTIEELVTDAARKQVEIRVAQLPPAMGDAKLIHVVVQNLLSNAFKFSAGIPHQLVEAGFRNGPKGTEYFVKDNGVGFDQKYVRNLFGVFQRLHGMEEFEGTGIGLALVKRIVERHGGRVWAEGEVGRGAIFWFTLGPG